MLFIHPLLADRDCWVDSGRWAVFLLLYPTLFIFSGFVFAVALLPSFALKTCTSSTTCSSVLMFYSFEGTSSLQTFNLRIFYVLFVTDLLSFSLSSWYDLRLVVGGRYVCCWVSFCWWRA